MISFLIEWYTNIYLILALVQFILTVKVYFLTIDPHTEDEQDDVVNIDDTWMDRFVYTSIKYNSDGNLFSYWICIERKSEIKRRGARWYHTYHWQSMNGQL